MAASDALPVPRKNVAYRVTFPILDADGDLVSGATGLDSEISKDAGTFADCTNEATEIATSSGVYYLDLTSTEMNADTVAIIVKTTSSGAKTTVLVMYPEEAGDYRADVTHFGGTAGTFSGGRPEVNTTHAAGTAWGSGAITASSIAADAITAAKVASDVSAEIADAVWDESTVGHTTAGTFGEQLKTDVDAILDDTGTSGVAVASGAISSTTFAAGAIDSAAIAANAIGASELAQDAAREIADEVLDRDLAGGASGGARNVRNALRVLRNKAAIAAGTLTVYQEDDTTSAWTAAVGTTAGDPISSVDPA